MFLSAGTCTAVVGSGTPPAELQEGAESNHTSVNGPDAASGSYQQRYTGPTDAPVTYIATYTYLYVSIRHSLFGDLAAFCRPNGEGEYPMGMQNRSRRHNLRYASIKHQSHSYPFAHLSPSRDGSKRNFREPRVAQNCSTSRLETSKSDYVEHTILCDCIYWVLHSCQHLAIGYSQVGSAKLPVW